MTLTAVERRVHHATIFELKVESYRRPEGRQGPLAEETKPRKPKA